MRSAEHAVSPWLYIFLAALVLLLPLQWVAAAIIAALFHELCHWIAIYLCSRVAAPVAFFSFGARMELPPMSKLQEALCALAGPIGELCLLLFARWLPRTAICAAFQSLYNLLPVYPMDGGRALRCILTLLLPPNKADKLCTYTEKLCILALWAVALYAVLRLKLGLMPIILAAFLCRRIKFLKMPCKVGSLRVQ